MVKADCFPRRWIKQVMAEIDVFIYISRTQYSGYDEILYLIPTWKTEYMVVHDYEAIYPHLSRYEKNKVLLFTLTIRMLPRGWRIKAQDAFPEVVQGVVLSSGVPGRRWNVLSEQDCHYWAAVQTMRMLRIVTDCPVSIISFVMRRILLRVSGNSHTSRGILL